MPFDQIGRSDATLQYDLDILRRARHRIREPSLWCKDAMVFGPQRCMIAAVDDAITASGKAALSPTVEDRLVEYLPDEWRGEECAMIAIADFNDAEATQHVDVLALFDRAIADLEKRLAFQLCEDI